MPWLKSAKSEPSPSPVMYDHESNRKRAEVHLDGWNIRLYYWTRNLGLLAVLSSIILGLCAVVAYFQEGADAEKTEPSESSEALVANDPIPLEAALTKGDAGFDEVCRALWVRSIGVDEQTVENTTAVLTACKLSKPLRDLSLAYWNSLSQPLREPNAPMLIYAHQPNPPAKANVLVAELYLRSGEVKKARTYLDREFTYHNSPEIRKRMVRLAVAHNETEWLRKVGADPHFSESLPVMYQLHLAVLGKDWSRIVPCIARLQAGTLKGMPLLLAGITGSIWLLVLLQSIQPLKKPVFRFSILPIALALGALSTFATLLASVWQEAAWNLHEQGTFLESLKFFILGVGLREETMKLALFALTLPILLYRKDRLEALVVASTVGLGFAITENLQYIATFGGFNAIIRLLKANFLHVAATGLIGCTLWDAIRRKGKYIAVFLLTFVLVVLAHGLWDVFSSQMQIREFQLLWMMVFLMLAIAYFRVLRESRESDTDHFCMAATVFLGTALVAGAALIVVSRETSFEKAFGLLAMHIIWHMGLAFMFFFQLGEGMSHAHAEELRIWKKR